MQHRSNTAGRRRPLADINILPFADVLLVLLVIFMAAAPGITVRSVDIPSVSQGNRMPRAAAQVVLLDDAGIEFETDGKRKKVAIADLGEVSRRWSTKSGAGAAVFIVADKNVQYGRVAAVMGALQRAGLTRVSLAVRTLE